MKFISVTFSIFIFLLSSCAEENITPVDQTFELLPLKIGNYWVYRVGIKDSYNDTILTFKDTLKVIEQNERGFLLNSSLQIILQDGCYTNGADGLYMNDSLQFKFPGAPGESCGSIGLGNILDIYGNKPAGVIFRTDYKYSFVTESDTVKFDDCYYYFLNAFYSYEEIKKTGYAIFKPGIGLVLRDWADINEISNEFYNPYAALIDYHIE